MSHRRKTWRRSGATVPSRRDTTSLKSRHGSRTGSSPLSQDVEEVIRKRLLAKNDPGASQVADIYATEHANFKTLFDFAADGRHYPNYRDEEHFVGTYPFVAYQFPLFQSAIEGISDHNIFEGRNSPVGERSMLGVVQEVASRSRMRRWGNSRRSIRCSREYAHR